MDYLKSEKNLEAAFQSFFFGQILFPVIFYFNWAYYWYVICQSAGSVK